MPGTIAYIDGLNLYYGALKGCPSLKWLNPQVMLETLLPEARFTRIRYFSTRIARTDRDNGSSNRQALYFRALNTVAGLTIHEGRMALRTKRGVLIPETAPPQIADIRVFEEKRTDVNIASHLLMDAFLDRYDDAGIVSNDSDLTTPVEMAVRQLAKTVIIINPYPAPRRSSELHRAASRAIRSINASVLRDSRFPDTLTGRGAPSPAPAPGRSPAGQNQPANNTTHFIICVSTTP